MKQSGYLEVIAGPMYSGKTEELIRLVKRAVIGKKHVLVFKHAIDTRYGHDTHIHTHSGTKYQSITITHAGDILKKVRTKTHIVAIDEAQWLQEALIPVVQTLLKQHKHVIVAGLAMTFDGEPFTPIPTLMAIADKVTKLSAICSICGNDAVFHTRLTKTSVNAHVTDPTLVAGVHDQVYEARCRTCFSKKKDSLRLHSV